MNFILNTGEWVQVGHGCFGAKDNSYYELSYTGRSSLVGAAKLVHTEGSSYIRYFFRGMKCVLFTFMFYKDRIFIIYLLELYTGSIPGSLKISAILKFLLVNYFKLFFSLYFGFCTAR